MIAISFTIDKPFNALAAFIFQLIQIWGLMILITLKFLIYISYSFLGIFKLADRMRSMRTNGASKNRDSWSFSVVPSKLKN